MSGACIGNFQVMGRLGTGAHSTILHIRRGSDSKHYALKVVLIANPEELKFLEQAQHEFRVAQLLDHPNLIKINALETKRDWLFRIRKLHLLIEYVNGQTLDTLKALSIPKLVRILSQVAAGMAHMHRRGVCHADLKPNNILLSKTGEVKIIDYGLAWIKGENKYRVQGTPEYMAPEQAKNSMVTERSDIFNFGATMYRLTTFRHPPSAIAAGDALPLDARGWKHILKPVQEFNAAAPPELCALIEHCLEFSALQRPERMSEIKDILDNLAHGLGEEEASLEEGA